MTLSEKKFGKTMTLVMTRSMTTKITKKIGVIVMTDAEWDEYLASLPEDMAREEYWEEIWEEEVDQYLDDESYYRDNCYDE